MRNVFGLINIVVGILALLVGVGNIEFMAKNPSSALAGVVALVVGGVCLWLGTEAEHSPQHS
jgi:hypothetical protein